MTDAGEPEPDPGIDLGISGIAQARLLDSGGFADVYEATDEFGRRVAIKVLKALDDNARRRFDRERSVMGMVAGHPHIVNPFTSGYASGTGRPYVVMEFLGGGSLEQLVKQRGPMTPADAISVVVQIAGALGASHRAGIIHKDVKPANVLLTDDGTPKLADFGIASIRDVSTTTALAYSPAYTPPETFSADASGDPRDERSDLYSLAATLFSLVTGRDPFLTGSESAAAAMVRILNDPPPQTEYPGLDRFLTVAMAKDPAQRYQDAASFADALNAVAGGTTHDPATVPPVASEPTVVATPPVWPGGESGPTPPAPSHEGTFTPPQEPPPHLTPAAFAPPGGHPPPGGGYVAPSGRTVGLDGPPAGPVPPRPAHDFPGHGPPPVHPGTDLVDTGRNSRLPWVIAAMVAAMVVIGGAVLLVEQNDGDTAPDSTEPTDDSAAGTTVGTDPPTTTGTGSSEPATTLGDLGDLAGTTVRIAGVESGEANLAGIEAALAAFQDETGIEVVYAPYQLTSDLETQIAGGNPPDIAVYAQPVILAEHARSGDLVPVPADVADDVALVWNGEWTGLSVVDGVQYGVPNKSDPKSLVWYQPTRFDELGYIVPRSWDELVALTEQAAADGNTPWCIGIESSSATGWVYTDWVEDVVLRRHGADIYDQWIAGDVRFSDPEIVDSFQEVVDLWTVPGSVYAASGSIAATGWEDNGDPLVNGDCLMHRQAAFYTSYFPDGTPLADGSPDAVDVFYLPSSDQNRPLVAAGSWAAAFDDRPEVWAVMRYLGSTEYADNRQAAQGALVGPDRSSGFLTAVNGVDRNLFSAIDNSMLDILAVAGPVRYDASDAMPADVGAGTFWSMSTRLVAGEIDVFEATEAIDESWPG